MIVNTRINRGKGCSTTFAEYVLVFSANIWNISSSLNIHIDDVFAELQTGLELFSDCETGVLPLSIFQYAWHRLNIHMTNQAKFGKVSDWGNKRTLSVHSAERPPPSPQLSSLWLREAQSWSEEKSSAKSDLICSPWSSKFCPLFTGTAGVIVYQWFHDLSCCNWLPYNSL